METLGKIIVPIEIEIAVKNAATKKALQESKYIALDVFSKSSNELRLTTGLAYPAMKADKNIAADGHRDFCNKEALRECAHEYLRNPGVTLHHQEGTSGHARVVESYVWPDGAPDWTVGNTVIKEGDWIVTCIWDEETWPLVKEGKLRGWSPEGGARRIPTSQARRAQLRG